MDEPASDKTRPNVQAGGSSPNEIPPLAQSETGSQTEDESATAPWWTTQPEDPPPNVRTHLIRILGVLILIILAIALFGSLVQNSSTPIPQSAVATASYTLPSSRTFLIDSRNGVALILDQRSGENRLYVKLTNQPGLYMVSDTDLTASAPALSPDGARVAFLSRQGDLHVVVAPVVSGTQQVISADLMQQFGRDNDFLERHVCPWTPLAWNPASDQIAFFVCNANGTSSRGVSAHLFGNITLSLVKGSALESDKPRQLLWMDDSTMLTTLAVTSTQSSLTLEQLQVP